MDIVAKARKNLLAEGYGKFDLIEKVLPVEAILNEKPRQLKRQICERLSLHPTDINHHTFSSWLRRFRNKRSDSLQPSVMGANKNKEDDWKSFQPSEPLKQTPSSEPLLKPINYK